MGSGGIAVTSMRSSAPCGMVPRRLGSAARLLGRVRPLLRLGSSVRSVFGMSSLVPLELFKRFGSLGVYAYFLCLSKRCTNEVIVVFVCVMGCVIESFHGFTPTWLRCAPHLGVILSYLSGFSLLLKFSKPFQLTA